MFTLPAKKPIRVWGPDRDFFEADALAQVQHMADTLPHLVHEIAVMPDAHLGKGACVGSVVALKRALLPAAVGVDIGCGMAALCTDLDAAELDGELPALRSAIEAAIPVGFHEHRDPVVKKDRDAARLFRDFDRLHPKVQERRDKAWRQLGTLGGGNHFIEVCLDENEAVWLMLHSGSRNIGKECAEAHLNENWKHLLQEHEHVSRDLAWVREGEAAFDAYLHDLLWCQRYAWLNRHTMLRLLEDAVARVLRPVRVVEEVQCHHNYAAREHHHGEDLWVTRKGAISARRGERGIIPGSMGARSYIVEGLGNEAAYHSASHGAGRRLSRHEARRRYSALDLAQQTEGVECRKDAGVVDEIPAAYKDIDEVMAAQADLVRPVHTLKQVLCVKG